MFNQMLFSWLDFVRCVCTSFEEELLKVLINSHAQSFVVIHDSIKVINPAQKRSVPVSQDAECYRSICLLGKVHIPRVPGSWRALFSHTLYNYCWHLGAFMFLLRGGSALTLRPGSPRSYCIQSLSALRSLRFIHSRVHLSPSCSGKFWLRRLNGETNKLSPQIGSSVGDKSRWATDRSAVARPKLSQALVC